MINIAVFASGSGTNFQSLVNYFRNHHQVSIRLLLCNNPGAGVIKRATDENVPYIVFNRKDLYDKDTVTRVLQDCEIDFIVLAGFLWLIPTGLLARYQGRIVNVHPALLPKYGGKGMFGDKVHKEVLAAGDKFSGITIHIINEEYDKGSIVSQHTCEVYDDDDVVSLANRVHELEHFWYPRVVEKLVVNQ